MDPVNIEIEDGLTGIVGPNGCGKSNIVEAFRWVMGESSAKQMRSDEMDNVIFGGSSGRPARDLAEVSLILDNTKKTKSFNFNEYDELEIKRRIERSKGSAWTINSQGVRARDVNLLFADNATGAKSSSIVSQGQVSEIINAKPDTRRGLLEEAANIKGLHQRRHEAELRLNAAETNLQRLDDIISTMQEQKRELSKQARQANRYKTVANRLRSAEATFLAKQYENKESELTKTQSSLREAERRLSEITKLVAKAETIRTNVSIILPELRKNEVENSAVLQNLNLSVSNFETQLNQIRENTNNANKSIERLKDDIIRETKLKSDSQDKIDLISKENNELLSEESQQKSLLTAAILNLNNTKIKSIEADRNQADLASSIQSLKIKTLNSEEELKSLNINLNLLRSEKTNLNIKEDYDKLLVHKIELDKIEIQYNNILEKTILSKEKVEQAFLELNISNKETAELSLKIAGLDTEYNAINRILLSSDKTKQVTLSQELKVNEGFESSVSAVLGNSIKGALEKGDHAFWNDLKISKLLVPPADTIPILDFFENASNAKYALSGVGVCKNEKEALNIQPTLKPGQSLTTANGGLWRWDGYIIPINSETSNAEILRQASRLRAILKEIDKYKKVTSKAEEKQIKKQNSHLFTNENHQNLIEEQKSIQVHFLKKSNKYNDLKNKLDFNRERQKLIEMEIGSIAKKIAVEEKILKNSLLKESEGKKLEELTSFAEMKRSDLAEAMSAESNLEQVSQLRNRRINSLKEELLGWKERLNDAEMQIEKLNKRLEEIKIEIKNLNSLPDDISKKRQSLFNLIEKVKIDCKSASGELNFAENQFNDANNESKRLESELRISSENKVRAEGQNEIILNDIKILNNQIKNTLNCSPNKIREVAGLKDDDQIPDLNEIEMRVNRLKREREEMGPVNLRAENEMENLNQQINELQNESNDLLNAISKLRNAIKQLNREGKERLLKAFDSVEKHFKEIFKELYGGGDAKLKFTENGDPLNSGLEIMASPPGKKLQSLSLLSGGEKALTALSLLFAVFLTNPSPICILDEVDAPLDDTNVARLCDLLQKIKNQTQTRFMLITHHRLTMARMDRLYGVTMSERGVSQLVSVNLQGAIKLKETA